MRHVSHTGNIMHGKSETESRRRQHANASISIVRNIEKIK